MDEQPCDIVDDGGVATEVYAQGFIALFTGAGRGAETVETTINVNTVDAATGENTATDAFGALVADAAVGSVAFNQALDAVQLLLDRARMRDTVPPLIGNAVTVAATAADASIHSLAHNLADAGRLADAVDQVQALTNLIARVALARDWTMQVLADFRADAAIGSGTAVGTLRVVDLIARAATGADALQLAQTLAQQLADRAAGADSQQQTLGAVNLVAVDGFGEGEALFDSGVAWTAPLETWAMSQWLNLPGDSIGVADGRLLIGGDGLFIEAAPDQRATIDLGISDMGSPQLKHLSYAYWHGRIQGSVNLRIGDHDDGAEQLWDYAFASESGSQWEPMRTRLGRGHRSRNFRLEVQPNGQFEMAEIRILHEPTSRKV